MLRGARRGTRWCEKASGGPGGPHGSYSPGSERIPRRHLHDPRRPLDAGEVGEIRGWLGEVRIQRNAESAAAGVKWPEVLLIENVEHLPAHLEFMPFQAVADACHAEDLAEARIERDIARNAEHVAFAGFAWIRVAESLKRRRGVAAEQFRSAVG